MYPIRYGLAADLAGNSLENDRANRETPCQTDYAHYPSAIRFPAVVHYADDLSFLGASSGTEFLFYDPFPTGMQFRPYRATLTESHDFNGVHYDAGTTVFFDLNGDCQNEDPGEPKRYILRDGRLVPNAPTGQKSERRS